MQALAAAPAVPAPLWLVDILHPLTLVLHFVAMNVLVAAAFVLATARAGEREMQRAAAGLLPPSFSMTVTLGVAPLLFLQLVHGERFYASSIHMAWPWIGVLFVLMGGYYAAYAVGGRLERGREASVALRALPFMALLVFSFVLAANVSLSEHPEAMAALGRPGWNLGLADTNVLLRWSHEIVGAIALGSLVFLVRGAFRRPHDAELAASFDRRGLGVLVGATVVAVLLGVGQLLARPGDVGGARAGASLGIGIVLGLLVPFLAWRHVRRPSLRSLVLVLAAGVGVLVAKVLLRLAVRARRLAAAGIEPPPQADVDVGPIVLFAVMLLVAIGCMAWLVRVALRAAATTTPSETP
ncbi:MAG: hypothetical protein AB7T63_00515 [Planctomycetota bacterium]